MKYENFEQVKSLVAEVEKCEKLIDEIGTYPVVKIVDGYNKTISSIAGYPTKEHNFEDFPAIATEFISQIKDSLNTRIKVAKLKIETL